MRNGCRPLSKQVSSYATYEIAVSVSTNRFIIFPITPRLNSIKIVHGAVVLSFALSIRTRHSTASVLVALVFSFITFIVIVHGTSHVPCDLMHP